MAKTKTQRSKKISSKVSSVSNHKTWFFGTISLMLGLTVLMILIGPQSIFLISFFYFLIAWGALYLPFGLVIHQVAAASVLTWLVLSQGTQPISPWLVNTLVYLGIGLAVNQEVGAIRQVQRHNEEIAVISHISSSLTKTLDLGELTNQVVTHIFSLFQADGCTIFLINEGKKSLQVICARERRNDPKILEQILKSQPRVGFGLVGWVAATGESILSGDAERDTRALHLPDTPFDEESAMGIPLKADEETIGVLWIYKLNLNAFNNENLQLAQIFANQVSVALANARLYEHLRHLSETDGLTGLLNSRSLLNLIERAIIRAQTTGGCVSLLFIDCDNFKKINDCFGHPVGDQFLRLLANHLLEKIRDGDVVIRYGGDEFVILLPNTNLDAAKRVGERLLETTRERIMMNNPNLQATISMGLATFPEHAQSPEELIKHADNALYFSKRNGRDQLNVYVANYESVCS